MRERKTEHEIFASALEVAEKMGPTQTDGKWLEHLIEDVAPYIKDWDIERCDRWENWEEHTHHFPNSTIKTDLGIDLVAVRRSDGKHIAIQSKARKLDEFNSGSDITYKELSTFFGLTADSFWQERWVVTNGNCRLTGNVKEIESMTTEKESKPIKLLNIIDDILAQQSETADEVCPHCNPIDKTEELPKQTKSCMQSEAISESVKILKNHAESNSGGLPVGQARGKIILPCGTGKTRISLKIIELLTPPPFCLSYYALQSRL